MNKILRNVAKEIFCKLYEKKLSSPTPEEEEYINEFKQRMEDLMFNLKNTNASPAWKNYCERIWHLTLEGDVRRFLRWEPILETMNVSFASYLKKELEFLKKSDKWDSKWKKAIIEDSFGSPIPDLSYRKSSDNLIHHAYHVAKFESNMQVSINDLDYVVEFGGGYGSMSRLFYNLGFKGKYILFDLPHFSLLQSFFLKGIGLQVKDKNKQDWSQILCISKLEQLKEIIKHKINSNSLFLSTWALSETPLELRHELTESYQYFSNFLIGYQHKYFGIDNYKYFTDLSNTIESINSKNNRRVVWDNFIIPHLQDNSYLFGKVS